MNFDLSKQIDIRPKPGKYQLLPELEAAIEVAMLFNQPLLLTGEPGTGKTLLAKHVAEMFHAKSKDDDSVACKFSKKPLVFNTKTTSIAKDLFYSYDAIGHFQNPTISQAENEKPKVTAEFLELQALGKAIALANPKEEYKEYFQWDTSTKAQSSVVLIDEIDKAPRDFTNDILNEIEDYRFRVKERDYEVRLNDSVEEKNDQRILIIMTSNSEKNLPDAFLRRCVFFNIEFPDKDFLFQIVKNQLSNEKKEEEMSEEEIEALKIKDDNIDAVLSKFYHIRNNIAIRKKTATAEIVAFIKMLNDRAKLEEVDLDVVEQIKENISLIAKTKEDVKAIMEKL